MNRFAATVTAGALLLTLAACGSNEKPAATGTETPLVPTATPTPTPTADPTTAAKAQILAAYANYVSFIDKGLREGGVSYPYDQVLTGAALKARTEQVTWLKGLHNATVKGTTRLTSSRVTVVDLRAKPPTASVRACIFDSLTAISGKTRKPIIDPSPGERARLDKLQLVKGKWLVYSTSTPADGCKK